jgi:O-antigen ligase
MPKRDWTVFGLALAGAGVSLAWCRFVADEYILPEVVVLSAGLLLAAAATAATAFARRRELPSLSTPLDGPLAAVLFAWALATACSLDPRYSLFGAYGGYTYGFWQVASCAALFQLTACAADEKARTFLMKAALSAAMLASAYALLQAAGLDPLVAAADLPHGRAIATLANPVFLGAYLALWLPVALHWALSEPEEKAFGRCALALISGGLLASVSRGAWLAAAAGAALYLGLTGRLRAPRWSRTRWACAGAAAALAAAWVVFALARRGALSLGRENARVAIWGVAAELFRRHPWLGVGPDVFEQGLRGARTDAFVSTVGAGLRLGHAHNDLLQVLATAGLAGLAAYLWLLAGLAAEARAALAGPRRARSAALAAGLAALFVNLQLNIVSLPAYASAALAAGLLIRPRSSGLASRRLVMAALLAFAAASTAYALRLASADHEFKLGRFERALALNPCELGYHLAYVNALSAKAGKTSGAERLYAVDRIAASGAVATACHPNDAVSHYILGSGALMQAIVGRPERLAVAEKELDASLSLDPYRPDVLDWRRQAAALRGDKDAERALLERLARVNALRR